MGIFAMTSKWYFFLYNSSKRVV